MDLVETGVYWPPELWDHARAAYLADFEDNPASSPDTFGAWLDAVLERHVQRGASTRAELARARADEPRGSRGRNKLHRLRVEVLTAVDDAITDDARTTGRRLSRSEFVREATATAVTQTITRRGRDLDPPPPRLPTHPLRRPDPEPTS